MGRFDCIILYNAASVRATPGSKEKIYSATLIREEVSAIEASLHELGFIPYVL